LTLSNPSTARPTDATPFRGPRTAGIYGGLSKEKGLTLSKEIALAAALVAG